MQPEAIVLNIGIAFVTICMGSLIGSVILRAATNWIVGVQVDATFAFFCVAFSYLPALVVYFFLMVTHASSDIKEQAALLMIPLDFVALIAIICWTLKFRIRTALKITAMMYLFGLMLFLLVWAVGTIFITALHG